MIYATYMIEHLKKSILNWTQVATPLKRILKYNHHMMEKNTSTRPVTQNHAR